MKQSKKLNTFQTCPHQDLNLGISEYHRRRGDMLQVFKIVNHISGVSPGTFFSIMNVEHSTVGHDQNFVKKYARLGVHQSVFSRRVVNDWNSLPVKEIYSRH